MLRRVPTQDPAAQMTMNTLSTPAGLLLLWPTGLARLHSARKVCLLGISSSAAPLPKPDHVLGPPCPRIRVCARLQLQLQKSKGQSQLGLTRNLGTRGWHPLSSGF